MLVSPVAPSETASLRSYWASASFAVFTVSSSPAITDLSVIVFVSSNACAEAAASLMGLRSMAFCAAPAPVLSPSAVNAFTVMEAKAFCKFSSPDIAAVTYPVVFSIALPRSYWAAVSNPVVMMPSCMAFSASDSPPLASRPAASLMLSNVSARSIAR